MKKQRKNTIIRFLSAGLFYLAVFLYTVVFNHSTGWLLLFFLTVLFLLNLVTLIPSLKKIQCHLNHTHDFERYQKKQINVTIFRYRPTLIPLPLFKITFNKTYQELLLYSGNAKELAFSWNPETRGVFQSLPVELTSADLFGFFTKKMTVPLTGPFIVMPQLQLTLAEKLYQQLKLLQPNFCQKSGHQTFSIKNFREYQVGDSLKAIDWKQSSKRNELIIKEFENEAKTETHFLFYGAAHENFEELVSVYYSFIQYIKNKSSFQQTILAENCQKASGTAIFSEIQPLKKDALLPNISNKTLVIFTAVQTAKLTEQIQRLEKQNEIFLVHVHENEFSLSWKDQTILMNHKGGQLDEQ